MAPPVIAWLTDFGTEDHYVGAMKGVALSIAPTVTLVDITHGLEPQDVLGGAMELAAACLYFPRRTVFVAVVDPGVGSSRAALAAEAGDWLFVGPDNGVLSLALNAAGGPTQVVAITNPAYALPRVSATFEGRDRFAPAAAWLTRGVALADLGPHVGSWQTLERPPVSIGEQTLAGTIVRIDRFGNAVTNIDSTVWTDWSRGDACEVAVKGDGGLPLVRTYADGPTGSACALFGSGGYLEIACPGGNAARQIGLGRGDTVVLRRRGKA